MDDFPSMLLCCCAGLGLPGGRGVEVTALRWLQMKNMVFLKNLKVYCNLHVKSMFFPKRSWLEDPYAITFSLPHWPEVSSGIHFFKK